MESVGWNTTSVISMADTLVQVTPASIERQMPVRVAASSVAPFGDIASRFTYHQLEFAVDGSCVQVTPLSTLVKTPAPRMPSAL